MNTESNGSSEEVQITRVPMVRREPLTPYDGRFAEHIADPVGRAEIEKLWELTTTERIGLSIDNALRTTKLALGSMPHVYTIIRGLIMKSWKTTVSGILGGIAFIVNSVFGLQLPTEAILATSLFFIGLFAKDGDVTGGTKVQ